MPTGYTARVADGTVTDLKTFALTLARGMGALVAMRDSPWDAPIPNRFEVSDYHLEKMRELKLEEERLLSLTPEEIKFEVDADMVRYENDKDEALRKHKEQKARYEAMIEKVRAWQGAPEGIKEFGLSQLKDSMQFDCREPYTYWQTPPETDHQLWLDHKLTSNRRAFDYHGVEHQKEVERTEARNEWIKQLKESLND